MHKILILSPTQVDFLQKTLSNCKDEGPTYSPWQSNELIELNLAITAQLNSKVNLDSLDEGK